MKIVFLTSGKGSGHVVLATSLFNALKRLNVDFEFILIGNYEYEHLCSSLFMNCQFEMQPNLYVTDPKSSQLYMILKELNPDFLVTDGLWFPLQNMLDFFRFKKIIFFRQSVDSWFKLESEKYGSIKFYPEQFDYCFSIEPGFLKPGLKMLNPFIIRNRDEIYSVTEAKSKLNLKCHKKVCIVAHNGFEGEFELIKQGIKNFDDDYQIITTSNRDGEGLYPLVDYFKGIDLIVGAAGYNIFYEVLYFQKEFRFFPQKRIFEDQSWRIKNNSVYKFDLNGADQLAHIIINN